MAVLPFIQSQIIHLACADDEAVSDEDYSAPCLSARVREEGAGHAEPHSRLSEHRWGAHICNDITLS